MRHFSTQLHNWVCLWSQLIKQIKLLLVQTKERKCHIEGRAQHRWLFAESKRVVVGNPNLRESRRD